MLRGFPILTTVSEGDTRRSPPRTRFFVALSGAMFAIVLIGFAHTLYLRALFDVPPTPVYVYVHGALLTAWFVLVVVQTALVRRGAVAAHRRLGALGAGVGTAVVVASLIVTVRFVHRIMHVPTTADVNLSVLMGLGADPPLIELAAIALWANLAGLATFTVLLAGAVLTRHRRDVHKRFMMLASLSILPPAIARISRWPGLGGDLGPFVPTVLLMLLCAMVYVDVRTRRRVHWATLAGGGLVLLSAVLGAVLAKSDLGLWVLSGLE